MDKRLRLLTRALLGSIAYVALLATAVAGEPTGLNIAFVNYARLMQESPQAKELKAELRLEFPDPQKAHNDFNSRQNEMLAKLQKQLVLEVQQYAQAQRFDLVLANGVIFANPKLDITQAVLTRLLADSAADYDHLITEAQGALSGGDAANALQLSELAISISPDRWKGYVVEGGAFELQHQRDDAIHALTQALTKAPQDIQASIVAMRAKYEEQGPSN